MPPPLVQIKRTGDPDKPPTGLTPGELCVEMADPTRLWVGVPVTIDPSGKKLLIDITAWGNYYTKVESDGNFVNIPGDTMTGALQLSEHPTAGSPPLQAATKGYVDQGIAGIPPNPDVSNFVYRTGDTMTGFLTANADPVQPLHYATRQYVDLVISSIPANPDVSNFVYRTGDTMTGFLTANADPVNPLHYATKQYFDNALAALPISGGAIPDVAVFSSRGTYSWTVPPGKTKIWVRVVGGGGGAYPNGIALQVLDVNTGSIAPYRIEPEPGGGGGGGGGWTEGPIAVTPGQVFTVLVGEGGLDGSTNLANTGQAVSGNGGTSSFAGFSATGGGGALRVNSVAHGFGGGRSGMGAGGPLSGGLGHGDSPASSAGVNNGGGPLGPGHGGDNEFNVIANTAPGGINPTGVDNPGTDGMVAIYY